MYKNQTIWFLFLHPKWLQKQVETLETQCKFRESFTLSKWFKKLSLKYCIWCILCICNSKKVAFFTLIFLFKKAKSSFLVVFLLTKFCKFTHCGTIDGYLSYLFSHFKNDLTFQVKQQFDF